jgi:hypothetical protein
MAAIPPPALSGSGSRVEGFGPPLSLATPRLPVQKYSLRNNTMKIHHPMMDFHGIYAFTAPFSSIPL